MTGSIFAGPEAAGGQEVSGARLWPFRPDKTDLQVNKHAEAAQRGDDIIRDGSRFKSRGSAIHQSWRLAAAAAASPFSPLASVKGSNED